MKRIALLLLCVIAALTGCSRKDAPNASEMTQPVSFYYLASDSRYHAPMGPMDTELRDVGAESDMSQILSLYFQGPVSDHLRSPFDPDSSLEEVRLEGKVLYLTPNSDFFSLEGAELTLAAACLVHTMTQFSDVEAVVLQASASRFTDLVNRELTTEDFVLAAYPETEEETIVSLYFPAEDSRSLVTETAQYSGEETPDEMAAFALRQLLNGPEEKGQSVFPKGTKLLDVQVLDGACTVDLSSQFSENRPETVLKTRMALLAAVNTLTSIEGIDTVLFSCENQSIPDYNGFDLSQPFVRDEQVISSYSNSTAKDATLYLPYGNGEKLIAVPVQLRRSTGKGMEKDVLGALISYQSSNGIINPIPEDTMVASVDVKNGLCRVTFNSVMALADNDLWQATMTLRSVVTTLCALPTVDQVQISIDGNTMSSVDISEPMTAIWKWIAS